MRGILKRLHRRRWHVALAGGAFSALALAYVVVPASLPARYDARENLPASTTAARAEPVFRVTHVPTTHCDM